MTDKSVDDDGLMSVPDRGPSHPARRAGVTAGDKEVSTIVNCVAYREGMRLEPFPVDGISEIIKQSDVFICIGLYEPDDGLLCKMQQAFAV